MTSIIIPTLNEEEELPATIRKALEAGSESEIILGDAGSTDRTVGIALAAGCRVLTSPVPGRAAQMNFAAAAAAGDVFLFLHADSWLGPGALAAIQCALSDGRIVGGAFVRRFRSQSPLLALTCLLAQLRNQTLGWHLGDQGIFVRRRVFEELNGFPPWLMFEDLEFSRRLKRIGRTVTLRPVLLSSARRFARLGPWKRTSLDLWLTLRYLWKGSGKEQQWKTPQ